MNRTEVAIKELSEDSHGDMEEFMAEADVMMKLPPHPNVVLLRGICIPPDPVVIVTDFCDEGSLLSLLEGPEISKEKKRKFIIDIACGMVMQFMVKMNY